jgi:hypothetical protein
VVSQAISSVTVGSIIKHSSGAPQAGVIASVWQRAAFITSDIRWKTNSSFAFYEEIIEKAVKNKKTSQLGLALSVERPIANQRLCRGVTGRFVCVLVCVI